LYITLRNTVIYATYTIFITEHGNIMKMYRKPCQKTWTCGGITVNAELIFLINKTYQLQINKNRSKYIST
jgi:hypothetical protein